jgi:kojibiose phosphorylase
MAAWNLKSVIEMISILKAFDKTSITRLLKRTGVKVDNLRIWKRVANAIYVPFSKKSKLIEEFSGYFKKRSVVINETDHNFKPVRPKGINNDNIADTQLIKQADVIMLFHLFPEMYSNARKKVNFDYYDRRTMHMSSLSAAIHSIVSAGLGDINKAYKYFLLTLYTDLRNIYGNAADGIHAASLGGTWQAVFNGLCGIRFINNVLNISPCLPPHWEYVELNILWKSRRVSVVVSKNTVKLYAHFKKKKETLKARIYNKPVKIAANKWNIFTR